MEILTQLEQDYTQALKSKDELAVLVLRQIKTALNNTEIANNREKLDNDGIIKVLRSEVKKRKDAVVLFAKGGRADLQEKEEKEIEIINKYLPAQLSEEVIEQKVEEIIKKVEASGLQDMGKVMGAVMQELSGQADGNLVGKIVKEKLG